MSAFKPAKSSPKKISFRVAGESLEGSIIEASDTNFNTLLIGGGGHIPYRDYYGIWQDRLASVGIGSMSFDFRGVGASEGQLSKMGLQTHLEDARGAAQYLNKLFPGRKLQIMGVSMGGAIAIQLANEIKADRLILVAPAAYSEKARSVSFGPAFTSILREERSWQDSPEFDQLEQFNGRTLLVYGEEDEVIPEPILMRYSRIVRKQGCVLIIPQVDHGFMRKNDPASIAAREEIITSLRYL